MPWLITKYLMTAAIVVIVSEAAKRSDRLGGFIGALPLVTVLTLIWLHVREPALFQGGEPRLVYILVRPPDFADVPGVSRDASQAWLLAHFGHLHRDHVNLLRRACPSRSSVRLGTALVGPDRKRQASHVVRCSKTALILRPLGERTRERVRRPPRTSPSPASRPRAGRYDDRRSCCAARARQALHLPDAPADRPRRAGPCPICGMALEPMMPTLDDDENPELRDFPRRFWWTLPLTLVVLGAGHVRPRTDLPDSQTTRSWLELVLSAPVVLWAGWPFFVRWAQSIANRSPNMWTLIGTGVGAAFRLQRRRDGRAGLFPASFREHGRVGVYFEAAAVIVSLTLLGQTARAAARARRPRRRSRRCCGSRRRPRAASRTDGSEEDIPLDPRARRRSAARAPGREGAGRRRGARGPARASTNRC